MRNPYVTPRAMLAGILTVATGGFLGSMLRGWLTTTRYPAHGFSTMGYSVARIVPWALLTVNAVGVYFAVLLLGRIFKKQSFLDPMRLFCITGFLGGLTSYSGLFVALYAIWQVSVLTSIFVGLGAILSGAIAGRIAMIQLGFRK